MDKYANFRQIQGKFYYSPRRQIIYPENDHRLVPDLIVFKYVKTHLSHRQDLRRNPDSPIFDLEMER